MRSNIFNKLCNKFFYRRPKYTIYSNDLTCNDFQNENDNSVSEKNLSIVEEIKQAAEEAVQETGYVYDEASGLYYDKNSGYYYDSVSLSKVYC